MSVFFLALPLDGYRAQWHNDAGAGLRCDALQKQEKGSQQGKDPHSERRNHHLALNKPLQSVFGRAALERRKGKRVEVREREEAEPDRLRLEAMREKERQKPRCRGEVQLEDEVSDWSY